MSGSRNWAGSGRMVRCTGGSRGEPAVVKEREGRMVAAAGGYMEEMWWEAHILRN